MTGVRSKLSNNRIGIWSLELRFGDKARTGPAAAELEALGFGAVWIPGGVGGDLLGDVSHLLASTSTIVVATGVLNIWKHDPADVVAWWKNLPQEHRSRTLLGLGVSHQHSIGDVWRKPLSAMRDYLARLADGGVPRDALCLAALGPKMLELAAAQTGGVHPYLVTPTHTALARTAMGAWGMVAPEQGVILDGDRGSARQTARQAFAQYQSYPNYVNSWRRLGFTDGDISDASDQLLDAVFAIGSIEDIRARIDEHMLAGADHVCLQAITGKGLDIDAALEGWRRLAALVSGDGS